VLQLCAWDDSGRLQQSVSLDRPRGSISEFVPVTNIQRGDAAGWPAGECEVHHRSIGTVATATPISARSARDKALFDEDSSRRRRRRSSSSSSSSTTVSVTQSDTFARGVVASSIVVAPARTVTGVLGVVRGGGGAGGVSAAAAANRFYRVKGAVHVDSVVTLTLKGAAVQKHLAAALAEV
jgi:hypothetical protein